MDHIGIDVHKRDSQIYILAEGGEARSSSGASVPSRRASAPSSGSGPAPGL
jgi:hypothetical protein